jgi:predicted AAA+ superfamily ATPase
MVAKPHDDRILSPPDGSFFLFGPRGTGKSTWAQRRLTRSHRIDLLDEGLYQRFLADPSLFAAEMATLTSDVPVIVDEIQRLPNLLNEVHRFIEDRGIRFALLGSSARKLKVAGTNLLAGRATKKQMFPLVPEELGRDFSIEQTLRYGTIPLIWTSPNRRESLEAYVQMYLREEIKAEALVRNLPGFARFLPIAALFHGQVVNTSAIARDAGTARTTVNGYLEILEDTLLAFRLPAFETRLRVRERKHPKLYWVDPGLVRGMKRQFEAVTSEERGPLLEGWIITLLRAYAEETDLYDQITYWSPLQAKNVEVDILLERHAEFVAIEVKAGARFSRSWLAGLNAIADLPGLTRRVLVYGGDRTMRTPEGIDVWTVNDFAERLGNESLWP